jgi:tungstate transport system substrate-binding protein
MRKARVLLIAVMTVLLVVMGSLHYMSAQQPVVLHVSTTTSLYATGLLDEVGHAFTEKYPDIKVRFIAVGSGEALARAERGDADLVLIHAPPLEKGYIESGVLKDHEFIAYNYFIIVGPADDPAGIRGLKDLSSIMEHIYYAGNKGKVVFVSRGDNSGTHVKELSLWEKAKLDPSDKGWYLESGAGMGRTLLMAQQKKAYTLSDTGTFLKFKLSGQLPDLEVLVEGSDDLLNIYSAYIVKPREASAKFLKFMAGDEGQGIIAVYGKETFGRPLFNPAKGKEEFLSQRWMMLAGG